MNIVSITKVMVVGKNERQGQDNKSYYSLACMQGGQCFNISVDAEIYNSVIIPDGTVVPVTLETAYNDQYKSFRAARLLEVPKASK